MILILISGLIMFIVVKKIVRRVTTVNTALNMISKGSYDVVCPVSGNDEISTIEDSVNKMKLFAIIALLCDSNQAIRASHKGIRLELTKVKRHP